MKRIKYGRKWITFGIYLYGACQLGMSSLKLRYMYNAYVEGGEDIYFNLITRTAVYLALTYMGVFIYRLNLIALYTSSAFLHIGWQLEEAIGKVSQDHFDIDSVHQLDVQMIQYYRNLHQDLAILIEEIGTLHSTILNGLYITVVARIVTTVYDVLLTGLALRSLHTLQIIMSLLRLFGITIAASSIHENSSAPLDSLYNVSKVKRDESLLLEVRY